MYVSMYVCKYVCMYNILPIFRFFQFQDRADREGMFPEIERESGLREFERGR